MMPVSDSDPPDMSNQLSNDQNDVNSTVDSVAETKKEELITNDVNPCKDGHYVEKRIITAINRSLKSNDKVVEHTFLVNGEEKNDTNNQDVKNRQSITVIVKRINLDEESILKEKSVPDIINLETLKVKEISKNDSNHLSSTNHSSEKKQSSSDRHRSDKHHSSSHHRSSSRRHDEHRSSKRYHISEETLKGPYLLCSCGRKESKKWVHPDCTNKCCRSTSYYCDSCLRRKIIRNDYSNDIIRSVNFNKYMYVISCPFGRGLSLHMDYDRIIHLRSSEQREVAAEFLKQSFKEDDKGFAHFTIAIVHNGAKYMPDILKMMAKLYPSLKVSTTKLKSSTESELTDLMTYYKKVKETYNNGTFAFDPLNETQAACVKNADECGGYLPELLSLLEKSPFLSQVLPWGDFTTKRYLTPHESDDGPIFWCRPGEQIIPLDRNSQRNRWNSGEIESFLKERKKNMGLNDEKKIIVEELKKYRRSCSTREFLFEDRTRPHADQAWSNTFEATAAVGVIQAIHPDEHPDYNRICKEIVVFQAKHLEMLEALLHIDFTAAPKQQCAEWLDDAKLNMIRQMKIQFSKIHLRDNDIYFIPRKVVHQFKTVSATLSIAWHTRIREYYEGKCEAETKVELQETPSKKTISDTKSRINANEKTPSKNTPSRSRSNSSSSRSRRTSSTPKKRKHKPQSSPTPHKRVKEESLPNGEESKQSDSDRLNSMASSDCGCLKTPVKLEPKEDENAPVPVNLCPRVDIVNFNATATKSEENDTPNMNNNIDKINDKDAAQASLEVRMET